MNKTFEFKKPAKTTVIIEDNHITISRKGLLNTINVGNWWRQSY